MKRYVFELEIEEGSDEFWEGIKGAGCDEVAEAIRACLDQEGWLGSHSSSLTLKRYENNGGERRG